MAPAWRILITLAGLVAMAACAAGGVLGIGWGMFAGDRVPFLTVLGVLGLLTSAGIGWLLWRAWGKRQRN